MVVGKLNIWAKGNYQSVSRLVVGNRLETAVEFILGSLCPAIAFEHVFYVSIPAILLTFPTGELLSWFSSDGDQIFSMCKYWIHYASTLM